MKKKILIINGSLRIGGVRRSLVNLLNNLDYSKYDVDLLLFYKGGLLLKEVPQDVNILNSNFLLTMIGMSMKEVLNRKKPHEIVVRLLLGFIAKIINNKYIFSVIFRTHSITETYDIGIAYSHNSGKKGFYGGTYQYLISNVVASKKIGWIHTDYTKLNNDIKNEVNLFTELDKIVHISKLNLLNFITIYPQLERKSVVVRNTVNIDQILELSQEVVEENAFFDNEIVGISVARLDKNKSLHRIIETVYKLKSEQYNIRWVIVGDGPEYMRLKNKVNALHLGDEIIFVGNKRNPYPYIALADILCVSSVFEGVPMVIEEAFTLGKPVIATQYASVYESITDEYNGLVVENSTGGVFNGVKKILDTPILLEKLKQNIKKEFSDKSRGISEFDNLIEELSK